MPETGWNAADLLQRADPSAKDREAQRPRTEGLGASASCALEDRVFDPDPETRYLAVIATLRPPRACDSLSESLASNAVRRIEAARA